MACGYCEHFQWRKKWSVFDSTRDFPGNSVHSDGWARFLPTFVSRCINLGAENKDLFFLQLEIFSHEDFYFNWLGTEEMRPFVRPRHNGDVDLLPMRRGFIAGLRIISFCSVWIYYTVCVYISLLGAKYAPRLHSFPFAFLRLEAPTHFCSCQFSSSSARWEMLTKVAQFYSHSKELLIECHSCGWITSHLFAKIKKISASKLFIGRVFTLAILTLLCAFKLTILNVTDTSTYFKTTI